VKAVRFRPPEIDATADLRWLVHRAFADPGLPAPDAVDGSWAVDLSRRLDLGSRIGARRAASGLGAEVGAHADALARAAHLVVASSLRYEGTLRQVAALASGLGVSVVVLKGFALSLLGVGPAGARAFGDLDLLVPVGRVVELRSALVAAGWAHSPLPASEHQEAPLTHPALGMIELHRVVPGVRPPGSRRSFDAETLLGAGLATPLAGFDGAVHAPSRAILVAHALEHGLVQHGWAPGSYPLFRMLADLQDLSADRSLLREAGAFLRDLDDGDLAAIGDLVDALAAGTAFELPPGPARALFHHILAGTLDPSYALALKSDPRSMYTPTDLPYLPGVLLWIWKSVVISRVQVDAIYGPPKRPGGYLARQLLRPFDLALRLFRSLRARGSGLPSTLCSDRAECRR
jgi:hypothetical protein